MNLEIIKFILIRFEKVKFLLSRMAAILDSPTFPQERCQFFGSQLANTTEFSDQELILEYGRTSNIKIRELKVFVSETHICGIQASYLISDDSSNVIGTKHIAPNPSGAVKEDSFTVEGDEFINEIAGRHLKTGVTYLEFKTTSGRSFSFGYKKGKSFSKSCVADQQFLVLRGGLGEENIHHVGFLAAPLPMFSKISFFQIYSEGTETESEEIEEEPKEFIPELTTVSNVTQRKLLRIIGSQGENCFTDLLRTRCYGLEYKPEEIRVSHNGTTILGIQATYQAIYHGVMVDGEKHYGRLWNEECTIETMQLSRDEYITTVFGRVKPKEITQVGFVTNHGREFVFGGQEGQKFIATAPEGNHIASIGGALLSGLGSIILEVLPLPKSLETESKLNHQISLSASDAGEDVNSMETERVTAVDCSDADILLPFNQTHKISQLLIAHDERRIYGLQASYIIKESDTVVQGARHFGRNWISELYEEVIDFENDEYIEEIFGDRSSESIIRFGIKTSLGKTYIFGSHDALLDEETVEFDYRAQSNNHFATLRCSVDSYLQSIDFEEIPKSNTEPKQASLVENIMVSKDEKNLHKNAPKFSPTFAGIQQGDTVNFSDEELLTEISPNHKISQIYIKYTGQKILSIQAIYEMFGDKELTVNGTKVESGSNEEECKEAWIQLESDEFISEVCGKLAGFGLIAFGIKTTKRKSYEFGSAVGEKFQIKAGKGSHCATFKYGLGKNMHYIEVDCLPVPKDPAALIHLVKLDC